MPLNFSTLLKGDRYSLNKKERYWKESGKNYEGVLLGIEMFYELNPLKRRTFLAEGFLNANHSEKYYNNTNLRYFKNKCVCVIDFWTKKNHDKKIHDSKCDIMNCVHELFCVIFLLCNSY